MDQITLLLYCAIGAGIVLAILYYLIKGAVKNGIIEANEEQFKTKTIAENK